MDPTPTVEPTVVFIAGAVDVLTPVWSSLGDSGVLPFLMAGAVIVLLGLAIRHYRKIAK